MGEVRYPDRWKRRWSPSSWVHEFTDENFDEALQGPIPVLVDFFAETCVPCRLQLPSIEQLGKTTEGQLRVGRLNVDQNPRTPRELLIKGVPHLIVVRNGEVVLEMVGDHSYDQLLDRLRGAELLP